MKKLPLVSPKYKAAYTKALIATLILFVATSAFTGFNPFAILFDMEEGVAMIVNDFFPPDFSKILEIYQSILVTLALAMTSCLTAFVFALALAFLGSVATSPFPKLATAIRAFAAVIRNIPMLVWAYILFTSLGIGTSVGFVALSISTFSFMLRAFIETIDETSSDVLEALNASGANFFQKIAQGVLPSAIVSIVGWLLYCIELNIRSSTIVGMVGGGGVGLLLFSYIKGFRYDIACGIILIIALMVIAVDALTNYLRKKVLV